MKTTINLDDELYRKLVNEALKKYGNTRSLSKVINENIASHLKEKELGIVSKKVEDEDIKKRKSITEETAGLWKGMKMSGAEYVRKLRDESEKRFKRLGI